MWFKCTALVTCAGAGGVPSLDLRRGQKKWGEKKEKKTLLTLAVLSCSTFGETYGRRKCYISVKRWKGININSKPSPTTELGGYVLYRLYRSHQALKRLPKTQAPIVYCEGSTFLLLFIQRSITYTHTLCIFLDSSFKYTLDAPVNSAAVELGLMSGSMSCLCAVSHT